MKYTNVSKMLLVSLAITAASLTGCTKPKEDSSSPSPGAGDSGSNGSEFRTTCGVVLGGDLANPVGRRDGIEVRVKSVVGPNLVIAQKLDQTTPSAEFLIKLHGISGASRPEGAETMLKSLSYGTLFFYPADGDCIADLPNGGKGVIGQLVTSSGKSMSEELAKSGLANIDSADACGGAEYGTCLKGISGSEQKPKGEIRKFLWKPLSDTKGNIAVVHELHCNTDLIVNGEKFQYVGGGNGRCGTFKATRPGCAYGANIRVEVIDKTTGQAYTHNGQPFVTVPNGCSRFEFE